MKKTLKIPSLLALLIVLIGTAAAVVLINRNAIFIPKAAGQNVPELVKITNVSDNSFTVSWVSQSPVKGYLTFSENNKELNLSAFDERDSNGNPQDSLTHYVPVKNLKNNTLYYFKINSGGKNYDNGGKPYEVTTAPVINLPLPASDTAYGMIVAPDGTPAKGAIVYVGLANATALSSLVKEDGSWMVPLSMARTASLNSYSNYDRQIQLEEIFVQAGNQLTISAITTTKDDSPVPVLTLGETYDFTQKIVEPSLSLLTETGRISVTPAIVPSDQPPTPTVASGFSLMPISASPSAKLTITNPGSDGETINTVKPEIKGTAPAREMLEINIQSENVYTGQVVVDENGNWQWTPPANLSSGEHTVTISYKDKDGLIQKVVRNFTVLAVGESDLPAFTATASATITLTPTERVVATPTATPAPPETGSLTVTIIFLIIGLALIILGYHQFKSN